MAREDQARTCCVGKEIVERVELEGVSTEADVGAGCWSCMALFVKKARFPSFIARLRHRDFAGDLWWGRSDDLVTYLEDLGPARASSGLDSLGS